MVRIFSIIALLTLLSCAKEEVEPTAVTSYKEAYDIIKDKDYIVAAEKFEKLSDDFAFSSLAPKAQMMAVYAYYKAQEYENVNTASNDFFTIFPSDKNTDYVMYIKGLSFYDQMPYVDRSQDDTRKASMIFREVVARYPQSRFIVDLKKKITTIDVNMAGSLMSKGRYFMNNEKYAAAIKNFQEVTLRYRHTNQICESYYRLTEIFYKIGIDDLAFEYAKNLKLECSNDEWLKKAKKIIKN